MIVAHISDTHVALDTPDANRRIGDFERTIADINALDPAPDLIVHTGDIVHNGRADEYAQAKAILDKANAPVHVMVGNKDDRALVREAFPVTDALSTENAFIAYAINDFPIKLAMLDTLNPGSNKGDFCTTRAKAFTRFLDANSENPVAVFAHHPPFLVPEGPEPLHFETPEILSEFQTVLQEVKSLIGIFCGHVHRSVVGQVGEITVVIAPSVATSIRWGDYPQHLAECPVYQIHTFEPDGSFSTQARIVMDD